MTPRIPDEALEEFRRLLLEGYIVAVNWCPSSEVWIASTGSLHLPSGASETTTYSSNLRNALLLAEAGTERRIVDYCKKSQVRA